MGVKGIRNEGKRKYTEHDIQRILRGHFMSPSSAKYQIENLFVYQWESDYLHVTKSDYAYEIEIKISRSDFFNDKKKIDKHQLLEGNYTLKKYEKEYPETPNYFYYAVPENLIGADEVPSYAGLIYINESWPYAHIIKTAPKLHSNKINCDKLNLIDKFYYNYIDWKSKAEDKYQNEINNLKEIISESKVDKDGKKYQFTLGEAQEKITALEEELEYLKDKKEQYAKIIRDNSGERRKLEKKLMDLGISRQEIEQIKEEYYEKS